MVSCTRDFLCFRNIFVKMKLPISALTPINPNANASNKAANINGIKVIPIIEIISKKKKGGIVKVAKNPQKKDFVLLFWIMFTMAISGRGIKIAMSRAMINMTAKKHR